MSERLPASVFKDLPPGADKELVARYVRAQLRKVSEETVIEMQRMVKERGTPATQADASAALDIVLFRRGIFLTADSAITKIRYPKC